MLRKIKAFLIQPHKWYRWFKTFLLDIRYGKRYLGRVVQNGDPSRGWHSSQNSNYDAFPILFSHVEIQKEDIIVDVGCGKGRIFNWLLHQGYQNKLIGIEVDGVVGNFAKDRLKKYSQVEIRINDVEKGTLPKEGTIFYLANSFTKESLMRNFHEQLLHNIKFIPSHLRNRPTLIYYNAVHLSIFEENPFWKIKNLGRITFTQFPTAIIEPNL